MFDPDTFAKFTNLQKISFDRTRATFFGRPGMMKSLQDTLVAIELYSMFEDISLEILFRKYSMKRLRVLRVTNTLNRLGNLEPLNFTGLPNLATIEMNQCKIQAIAENTFDKLSKSLKRLDLRNNHLKSLPLEIFNEIVYNILNIHLDGNPWMCHENLTRISAKLRQNNIFFDIGDCINGIPGADPTSKPTTDMQTTFGSTVPMDKEMCVDKFLPKHGNFSIRYNEKFKVICIESFQNGPSQHFNMIVLFFSHCVTNQTSETCREKKAKWCSKVRTSTGSVISIPLPQKDNRVVHSICVVRENSNELHPLHCLSFTPKKTIIVYDDIWISYNTKYWVISTATCGFIFTFLIGIFIAYVAHKINPKLLKGNRRVIIVDDKNTFGMRKPSSTVMIMPKEWSSRSAI